MRLIPFAYGDKISYMDKILTTLLGSAVKAKLLRLFLSNPEASFTVEELAKLTRAKKDALSKELKALMSIKIVNSKSCQREVAQGKGKNKKNVKRKTKCYSLDMTFPHLQALRRLLLDISPAEEKELVERLGKVASLKLLLISGVLLQEKDARVDIFLVGNKIKQKALERAVGDIESVVGMEIRYVAFTPEDFSYRLSMYDKLVRDVLDFPHKILINKLGDSWQELSMV